MNYPLPSADRRLSLKEASLVTAEAARATVRSDVPGTQRGVALLVVLVTMAVMGALSTEFAYNTRANIWMAGNVTASTQAYYHARSVSKIATLAVNAKRIFPQLKTVLSMMGKSQSSRLEIWRQACEFAKIFATGKAEFFGLQVLDLSNEDAIGFNKGSFECAVTAEDSRTNLNAAATDPPSNLGQLGSKKPRNNSPLTGNKLQTSRKQLGLKLYGLLRPMLESGQFDSEEEIFDVIINVMDWTDSDELRTDIDAAGNFIDGAGDEGRDYSGVDYEVKNAKMDTVGEVQLVAGMEPDVYCQIRDKLTVFSTGKLNVNDADLGTLKGVICQGITDPTLEYQLCWNYLPGQLPVVDQALLSLDTCRQLKKAAYSTPFTSMGKFISFLRAFPRIMQVPQTLPIDNRTLNQHLGVLSTMVRVEATGEYKGTKRKITTIYDLATGEPVYHNVN